MFNTDNIIIIKDDWYHKSIISEKCVVRFNLLYKKQIACNNCNKLYLD